MPRTEQIWKDYHGRLHSFIRGRVNDTSAADDILQEVFVRIQSRIGTLKEERKLQSWLYQITRHAIIDHYRRVKKSNALPEQFAAPEKDAVETARQEIAGCLLPIIQNLPHHYRESLFLSKIEGLSQKRSGDTTGADIIRRQSPCSAGPRHGEEAAPGLLSLRIRSSRDCHRLRTQRRVM